MMDLILDYADRDENVRAVLMNGSRANPLAKKDPFQDYDIVYLVVDDSKLRGNIDFIKQFGELLILQLPDEGKILPPSDRGTYCYLSQFTDGNRIDLTIQKVSDVGDLSEDSLTVILMDKDGVLPSIAPPDESSYLIEPPDAIRFEGCCNEFWWVSVYVGKGLWRDEFLHSREMMDKYVRDMFLLMLQWFFGVTTDFSLSPGKGLKNVRYHIDPKLWDLVLESYENHNEHACWSALFAMGSAFRMMAEKVGDRFGYRYNRDEDRNVTAYLEHIRVLPRDAESIFP